MNKQEKQAAVVELKNDFGQSSTAFLVGVHGLSVAQIQSIRNGVRQQGGKMLLAKNSLMEIASREIEGAKDLSPYFKDQVAIVFAYSEPAAVAKTLADSAKEQQSLKFVAGYVDYRVVDAGTIQKLAKLPSRNVLLAQLCGTLNAPIAALANILKQLSEKNGAEVTSNN
jgi:large subunit ribosomal protein L10